MKYYGFWRSLAACRVRIALAMKGVKAEEVSVNLMQGEQLKPEYRAVNPLAVVPSLVLDEGGTPLFESMAIIEYLDETHPSPPLLPRAPVERARVRALALAIACDLHPLNNTRVLSYIAGPMGAGEDGKLTWYRHWIAVGLQPLEAMLAGDRATGRFCHGDTPGLADCCLVPQLANARRFKCDVAPYPTLVAIEKNCLALEAFQRAAPDKQPDAE